MAESNILYIRLTGSPRQRGERYGRLARERIRKVIAECKVLLEKTSRTDWDTACNHAQQFTKAIGELRPGLLAEIEGIAFGAGVSKETILLLNCRPEVLRAAFDESSIVGIPKQSSANGHVLLGQAWDSRLIGNDTTVILEVDQKPYAKALIVTAAGLVGGIGINQFGLAQTFNFKPSSDIQFGVPLQILLRQAVSEKNIADATGLMAKKKRSGSGCVGLASGDDSMELIEFTPTKLDVLRTEGKTICQTDQQQPPIVRMGFDADVNTHKQNFSKSELIRKLISEKATFSKDDLFKIFSGHAGIPDRVCKQDDMKPNRQSSRLSLVMEPGKRTLWLKDGSPCSSEAHEYKLEQGNT